MPSSSRIKLAVCQYGPRVGDLERNAALGLEFIEAAAAAGAELVVLPELASSGYAFASEEEAERSAQAARDEATLGRWLEACRRHSVHVVAGFAERAPEGRYNSAALLGPQGLIGVYRKAHLFNDEKSYFLPGPGFPVFELPFGRVGILICYDLWFPEAARALALAGADLICVPTNWVGNFREIKVDERGWTMGDYACVAAATQNQVYLAAADRIGEERQVQFLGCSCVVGPDGWMVAGPGPLADEGTLLVEIDLERARRLRQRTPRNRTLEDRRPDLYGALVDSAGTAG